MNNSMTAEERREAWMENQFQYGEDHQYWDYAQWISLMLDQALEHIEGLVGKENAAAPLRKLVEPVANVGFPGAETWRDVTEDVLSSGTVWPISERLSFALLYGLYGVTPSQIPSDRRAEWLFELVEEVKAFAARKDVVFLNEGENAIVRIARLAASRQALDLGNGELDIHSLAVLGSISEGRLRNLMSGDTAQLERGPNGGVIALSALSWLQKRKGFLASIWQEDDPDIENYVSGDLSGNMIFVPVARDGSIFNPSLLRNGKFQIGAKGEEQEFENYDAALESLNMMVVPRWRRPNEVGNWGIVSGVAWQRVSKN